MHLSVSKYNWIIILTFMVLGARAQNHIQTEIENYVQGAPFKMAVPELPRIPNFKDSITAHGAIGDGSFLNTTAIQKTIDLCAAKGGGKVIIPAGIWLTAPIELKSNINLHLREGAILLFIRDHTKFPLIGKPGNFSVQSPVYGQKLHDIAITGTGIINGNGDSWRPLKKVKTTAAQWKSLIKEGGVVSSDGAMWWPSKEAMNGESYLKEVKRKGKLASKADYLPARDFLRPYMVLLSDCQRVLIDGPTFMNAPKFALVPKRCTDLVIRDVKINNEWYAQNGDGMDISDSKRVVVYKCTVTAGDDGICMKSNFSQKDSGKGATLKNIIIADSKVYHGHGGFVIGSNEGGGMENIYVKNCSFIGTDAGIRVKSGRDRGGLVHHIFIDSVFMNDIQGPAIVFNSYYEQNKGARVVAPVTRTTPRFEYFYISHVYCASAKESISLTGLPESPVNHIYFDHINIRANKAYEAVDTANISFHEVKINGVTL